MKKCSVRLVALLLLPCLVHDPAWALSRMPSAVPSTNPQASLETQTLAMALCSGLFSYVEVGRRFVVSSELKSYHESIGTSLHGTTALWSLPMGYVLFRLISAAIPDLFKEIFRTLRHSKQTAHSDPWPPYVPLLMKHAGMRGEKIAETLQRLRDLSIRQPSTFQQQLHFFTLSAKSVLVPGALLWLAGLLTSAIFVMPTLTAWAVRLTSELSTMRTLGVAVPMVGKMVLAVGVVAILQMHIHELGHLTMAWVGRIRIIRMGLTYVQTTSHFRGDARVYLRFLAGGVFAQLLFLNLFAVGIWFLPVTFIKVSWLPVVFIFGVTWVCMTFAIVKDQFLPLSNSDSVQIARVLVRVLLNSFKQNLWPEDEDLPTGPKGLTWIPSSVRRQVFKPRPRSHEPLERSA